MNALTLFEQERSRLQNLAYSMLGSVSEAEDIVQEAYVRWTRVEHDDIQSPRAYLSTIVSRLCLDQLKSARARREQYIGPWLPEPVVTSDWQIPDRHHELTEELTLAFLHTLEELSPVQRAVFLLHDIFGYTFKEVGNLLDRKPAACRKTAQRSREKLQQRRPRPKQAKKEEEAKAQQFIRALQAGDMRGIEALLAKDAILYSDGGGEVSAVPKPIYGGRKIRRFLHAILGRASGDIEMRTARINGMPGILLSLHGQLNAVWTFAIADQHIDRIYIIRNPRKIEHLQ